jgi:serine acetyltransferase
MGFRTTLRADFARPANQGTLVHLVLLVFRWGQHAKGPTRIAWKVADLFLLRLMVSAELPPSVRCGPGIALPHAGRGVVLHPNASIGPNCMIFHRVTLAATADGAPQLADNVVVGVGAVILGPVNVGSRAMIGANAVVTRDVEPGTRVAGVPARPL